MPARLRTGERCVSHWRERLFGFADRALDAQGELQVGRHLALCAECRAELARARRLVDVIRRAAAIEAAPASLRARVGAVFAAAAARQDVSRR